VKAQVEGSPDADEIRAALEHMAASEAFRGSPIRRTKRSGLRRNAAIAMGNSGEPEFLPLLDRLTEDEDELVAESARWAKARILDSSPFK